MQVGKIQQQISFGAVYKVPVIKRVDIEKFETTVAPLYRSMKKKAINGIDAGAIGFLALTNSDAREFDKYNKEIRNTGIAFNDVDDNPNPPMSNVLKLLSKRDFIYARAFIKKKQIEKLDTFETLTEKLLNE